jgi:DNA-binding CsgD family transcriptional regulator
MSSLASFCQLFAKPLAMLNSADFYPALTASINGLVPFDEACVITYENASLPIFDFLVPDTSNKKSLDIFTQGAFLLDPYYVAATRENKRGFFKLRDLAPDGFRRSEYYRIYYRQSGLHDECGFLVAVQEGGFLNIALGKTRSRMFTREQLSVLADIEPIVSSLCLAHWQQKLNNPRPKARLRKQLGAALGSFGTSILTNRESQVINLILLGHTTRQLAKVLGISPETVKLHRKHAYHKLDIKTQSELFYLFIDSLMSTKQYSGDDPLVAYLKKPRQT